MNTSELMIGDWFYWKGVRKQVPVLITRLGRQRDLTNFEPIPLTKEILLNNGWSEDTHFFPEDKDYCLELHIYGNRVLWTINCWEYDIMPLKYVHELQHALKLCRIEKIINL